MPATTRTHLDLTLDEQATVAYYNQVDWRRPAHYWDKEVTNFIGHLQLGCTVLEIGCGEAYPADLLTASGFGYSGTDISEHFVELARDRRPDLDITNSAADDLDFMDGTFGGYLALNVFQHIERHHLPGVLREARRVLKPGGIMYCTVAHHPEGYRNVDRLMWEKRTLGMESTRLFVFWKRREIERLFRSEGFVPIDYHPNITNTAGVAGDSVYWHVFALQRR